MPYWRKASPTGMPSASFARTMSSPAAFSSAAAIDLVGDRGRDHRDAVVVADDEVARCTVTPPH